MTGAETRPDTVSQRLTRRAEEAATAARQLMSVLDEVLHEDWAAEGHSEDAVAARHQARVDVALRAARLHETATEQLIAAAAALASEATS